MAAITDLTGTKWLLNESFTTMPKGYPFKGITGYSLTFRINFVSNSNSYTFIDFEDEDKNNPGIFYYATYVWDLRSSWVSQNYRTIEIIDGTDVTNTDLIDWLQSNATQIIEPSGYTVSFNSNGGTTISDIEEVTELPNPLPTPTKSGYTFVGWYYDSNFTTQAQASDTLSANVTLYAKWTLNSYTITFNSNGGSSVSQVSGVAFLPNPLPTTTKANHVFAGWYYDNLFTQKANAGDELTANVTLYAKWYTPTTWCEDIADAIREKEGSSGNIKHVDFADRIRALVVVPPTPSGFTVTITNISYPDTEYASSEGYLSYSLDNGTTWVDITSSGVFPITLNSVSKIRFKLTKTGAYLCSLKDVTHDTFIATGTTSGTFDEITLIENTTYNVWIMKD